MIRTIHLHGSLEKAAGTSTIAFDFDDQKQMFAAINGFSQSLKMAMRKAQFVKIIATDPATENYEAVSEGFNFGKAQTDIHVVPEVEGAIVIPLAWYWVVAIYVAVAVATSYIAASLARHMNSGSNGPGGPQSTMFNGPQNSTDQGGPIPIIYGKQCLVGSTVMATDTDYFNIA